MARKKAPKQITQDISVANAHIIFRNFRGEKSEYNKNGLRSFCVLLDADIAEVLSNDGWNIKTLKPREDGDPERKYIQVKLIYNKEQKRGPRVLTITSYGKTELDEEDIHMLDWADIEEANVVIRPYNWGPINGNYGVAAYLKSLYVVLEEDEFERKYRDIPREPAPNNDPPFDG